MDLLINIDVPDLDAAANFYTAAFGLTVARRLDGGIVELSGLPARVYLLHKPAGSPGAGEFARRYDRHWTPVHLDIVVDDIREARTRATAAGAIAESEIVTHAWGSLATLADPFGHGFCLIEFSAAGYAAIVELPDDD